MIHDLDTLAYQTLELVVGFSVCVQFPLLFHILSPAYLSLGFLIFMPTIYARLSAVLPFLPMF